MENNNQEKKATAVMKRPEREVLTELIDPDKQIEFASKAANALIKIMQNKPKKVIMNGEQYLEFEDWQTIARFYNVTAGVEWTKEIVREGKLFGFEAKAVVYNAEGTVISAAESSCLRDEPNWLRKPEFQLKSMAQTRASAKALRNVLAWVVVLAGFKPTPAEEVRDMVQPTPVQPKAKWMPPDVVHDEDNREPEVVPLPEEQVATPVRAKAKAAPGGTCSDCQQPISVKEMTWSMTHYMAYLCFDCQKKYKKIA
jgi:hypothetical protein